MFPENPLHLQHDDYYRLLQEVRVDGNWEDWLTFFLTGVLETRSIVREITGQQYRKLYAYREYLDSLNEDTQEPAA